MIMSLGSRNILVEGLTTKSACILHLTTNLVLLWRRFVMLVQELCRNMVCTYLAYVCGMCGFFLSNVKNVSQCNGLDFNLL